MLQDLGIIGFTCKNFSNDSSPRWTVTDADQLFYDRSDTSGVLPGDKPTEDSSTIVRSLSANATAPAAFC